MRDAAYFFCDFQIDGKYYLLLFHNFFSFLIICSRIVNQISIYFILSHHKLTYLIISSLLSFPKLSSSSHTFTDIFYLCSKSLSPSSPFFFVHFSISFFVGANSRASKSWVDSMVKQVLGNLQRGAPLAQAGGMSNGMVSSQEIVNMVKGLFISAKECCQEAIISTSSL